MDGNPVAQETLYNKYKRIVKAFIKKKYSLYFDLDDDVSEILIKAFLNLNSFDATKSSFKSWVLSIAKNYMIDKWRCSSITMTAGINCAVFTSSNCLDNYSGELSGVVSVSNTLNGNAFVANSTFTTSNSACFDNANIITYISTQLTPQDFALLDMKYIQGYDYCEIGKEFNVTSSTISNRVNYIKTKLKKNNSEIIYDE